MKKQVLHWIPLGMFPGFMMFSCGFTYTEMMGLLKKKKAHGWHQAFAEDKKLFEEGNWIATSRTIEIIKTGKKVSYVAIFVRSSFNFSDSAMCKLAHEIVHICQFYLPDILNRDIEIEAEAYFHTYLMQECLRVLRGEK